MRMTKQRKMMLDILETQIDPQSAEKIHQMLPEGSIDLSTVYRTLDAFFKEGLVSKSYLDTANYYYLVREKHHHYMICLECHKKFEIDCQMERTIDKMAKKKQFSISHHDMTVYGYCEDCVQLIEK